MKKSEARVTQDIRITASQNGWRLFRNNSGVAVNPSGQPVRYGLANESAQLNKQIKSSDLIGIRPVVIGPEHIGQTIGQFVAIEVKAEGWTYSGTEREQAQQRFIDLVNSLGGHACFMNGSDLL